MSDSNITNLNDMKKPEIQWRKYTKLGIFLIAAIAVLLLIILNVFIVKEGEYRVIRQFGEVVRIEEEPGLSYKIPFIQSVSTLPKYQMTYDVSEAEINTKDKKRMMIDNYAVWRIEDPKKMISNARNVINAEARMEEFIYSVVRAELGKLNYVEIINDEKSNRGSLNDKVTERVNELLDNGNFGITVKDIRMKRTDLPETNEKAVYTAMISEREKTAQEYLSMGDAQKQRIMADTDREVTELLATAKADANVIRAEGESEAAKIYNKSFSKDPDFYQLFRTLESYKKTVDGETVLVLPSNSPYAQLLSGYTE
ncbi:protease modulator HflC [Rossellomorea vietnamensis]|uniref:Protein HflC n=2 Tax=Rossellomorea TaxID=2837508 RepID=A0A5D4KI24_9BACI|nr:MULTISPECIES: protease modulator HflC [Rossellomorea]TYR76924.1 protease modulator HflC [Rossellomorea vietnamensis]TYS84138.1 protease modulator HflC [Rossellomorea aquimaris]